MTQDKPSCDVQLKFCGLTTAEHFLVAEDIGVDFCGINLVPTSPRFVSVQQAAELSRVASTRNVLVCRDESIEALIEMTNQISGVVAVQLHGNESPEFSFELRSRLPKIEVWKALPCSRESDFAVAQRYQDVADLILFDSGPRSGTTVFGGDGQSFDWAMIKNIKAMPSRWGLAGGVRIETIGAAIETGAQLIDVASGIEYIRGQKSAKLMREFWEGFKRCIAGN